ASDGVVEPLGTRQCAEEEEQEREGKALAALQRDPPEAAFVAVQRCDLASVPNDDAVALELVDQVIGHRLAEVGAAGGKGDARAATGEPDGCLAGGVAPPDHPAAPSAPELAL